MNERAWFSIVEDGGVKMVCHHGFLAEYWKDDLWSVAETRGAYFPLSELVASDDLQDREDVMAYWVENSYQRQGEYHADEVLEMRDRYYDGKPGERMCLTELSMDTPCGDYWLED